MSAETRAAEVLGDRPNCEHENTAWINLAVGYHCYACDAAALAAAGCLADDREGERAAMRAFVAGWFAHARNPSPGLLVEDAWHAYRLVESVTPDGGDQG